MSPGRMYLYMEIHIDKPADRELASSVMTLIYWLLLLFGRRPFFVLAKFNCRPKRRRCTCGWQHSDWSSYVWKGEITVTSGLLSAHCFANNVDTCPFEKQPPTCGGKLCDVTCDLLTANVSMANAKRKLPVESHLSAISPIEIADFRLLGSLGG